MDFRDHVEIAKAASEGTHAFDEHRHGFDTSAIGQGRARRTTPLSIVDVDEDDERVEPPRKSAKSSNRLPLEDTPCKFYLKGACRAGDDCPYFHPVAVADSRDPIVANVSRCTQYT